MYFVYILRSEKDDRWYTGYTNDLDKRVFEHNSGQSTWTKRGMPWELIYYEACLEKDDAQAREKYLKSGPGKTYLKKRMKRFVLKYLINESH